MIQSKFLNIIYLLFGASLLCHGGINFVSQNSNPDFGYKIINENPPEAAIISVNIDFPSNDQNIIIPESVLLNDKSYLVTELSYYSISCDTLFLSKNIKKIYPQGALVNINKLIIPAENQHLSEFDNCIYNKDFSKLIYYKFIRKEGYNFWGDCVLHPNTQILGTHSLYGLGLPTTINLPNSLRVIEKSAFCWTEICGNSTLNIPEGVESIADEAFSGIGGPAFWDYQDWSTPNNVQPIYKIKLFLPSTLQDLSPNFLDGFDRLYSVKISNDNPFYGVKTNIIFDKKGGKSNIFLPGDHSKLIIPSYVDTIRFGDLPLNELHEIIFENPFTVLKEKAFYNASIENITLPGNIECIEDSVFAFSKINSISLPNSLERIGKNVFFNSSLCYLYLPSEWDSIPERLCNHSKLYKLNIPKKIKMIGKFAFSDNPMVNVSLPEGLEIIDEGAFFNTHLANINLPHSLSEINDCAFANTHISNVTFHENLLFLGNQIFGDNTLSLINISAVDPPEASQNTFNDYTFENAHLYVPEQSISLYKEAEGWKEFKNIYPLHTFVSFSPSSIKVIIARYNILGIPVDENYRGIVIVKYDDGSTETRINNF